MVASAAEKRIRNRNQFPHFIGADLTKSFVGRRNHPQVQFPIGFCPLALALALALALVWVKDHEQEQEQEQEADFREK